METVYLDVGILASRDSIHRNASLLQLQFEAFHLKLITIRIDTLLLYRLNARGHFVHDSKAIELHSSSINNLYCALVKKFG